eukprot:tig00020912_g15786.t1
MESAFSREPAEVAREFGTHLSRGLSDEQVDQNRKKYGRNEIPPEEGTPFWKLVLKQFEDQLVQILLAAAIVSFILAVFEEGEDRFSAFVEPFVIVAILVANATVGVIQESNAEHAIEALKAYEPDEAVVVRNGQTIRLPHASELVCGDLVEVSVGMKVPADIRVVELLSTAIRVDQAILTGESSSVAKYVDRVADSNAVIQDKTNMLFSVCVPFYCGPGTTVVRGRARGIVVGAGPKTEIGKIRREVIDTDSVKTPLKEKLDEFGEMLTKVIGVICILVWVINIGNFTNPAYGGFVRGAVYYFKIAVALAVAAIPEGLPAVVTTCLALGTVKMAKKNAIVRNLPSVETLGCTSVICSDKTGTLTTNQMSVSKILLVDSVASSGIADLREFNVSGTTYAPVGEIRDSGSNVVAHPAGIPNLAELAKICTVCNDASVDYNKETESYEKIGEPTEVALKVLTEKIGRPEIAEHERLSSLSKAERNLACCKYWAAKFNKLATLEFSRDRKSMSVLVQGTGSSGNTLLVKGAPENILQRCKHVRLNNGSVVPLTIAVRDQIEDKLAKYGKEQTLRCIGFAYKEGAPKVEDFDFNNTAGFVNYERDMVFVGAVGMLDPPRPEVRDAIETCRSAGIRVIVITGDNKATAESICKKIGIFDEFESLEGKSYTGREFDDLSEDQKIEAVKRASLFCRAEPSHKSKLVDLLQSQKCDKQIVAMTGDGVNDAPALKKADIGIAMGSGTAVAKGASAMVLADDNFSTIVGAVQEGRAIYNNTKQFIRYLISSNIGEVVCIFLTAAVGMPEALIPVQLLWVNLVTDGLPATALGFNKPDKDIMTQPPRKSSEPIVNRWLFFRYLVIGTYVGLATVLGSAWWFMYYSAGPQMTWAELTKFDECTEVAGRAWACSVFKQRNASSVSLSILVTIEMFNALNSLSENQSVFSMPPYTNPLLLVAIALSFSLHFAILYLPFLSKIFFVAPLNYEEWQAVFWLSLPVLFLDEGLKMISRIIAPKGRAKKD